MTKPIAVLGAGAWGSALSLVLANNGIPVHLWGHNAQDMQLITQNRENKRYLPGIMLPDLITLYSDIQQALQDVQAILIVVPSSAFSHMIDTIVACDVSHLPIAWGSKGLTQDAELLSTYAQKKLGDNAKICVLSGPSFAIEVATKKPTAITAASSQLADARFWQTQLHNDYFRVYTSPDMIGAQLGGACKNILAIAVGIADGLQLGGNARAALITRGFAEIMRLGKTMGAIDTTLMGLSGMGDLILTCTENKSRNRRFGLALGEGQSIDAAKQSIHQVIEGIEATQLIYQMAKRLHVDMPIAEQMYHVLYHGQRISDAIKLLLTREPKDEIN